MPFNPYYPEPFSKYLPSDIMDYPNDFLVGEEYWDYLGGEGIFIEIINIFDEVSKLFKNKLRLKFREIAETVIYSCKKNPRKKITGI